ncbi:LLM class F420-dependent oxidoreductase [Mycobacterium paraseoulense]|uniref:LLM class F420-dependent oxidoreductase n=1 Tax=Mycobacterium paraseoulense TaxID=590652 RepID=A0A1X0IEZ9_9MYCO|nr:LLM class F420-dependent oxidoreductase [Mycobacterium paraseoulense]MCV7393829.1 LLM class F420-dependent oxidoreductase [Mycobacterium paraseoulense]ORB45440.1 LLM class F420-dependent oxidoreductase [Mycobacterium paraseoulense]BBZ70550.1 LLM class F420-dependent oxidoreductase [Mycobacterium paraseoulense]
MDLSGVGIWSTHLRYGNPGKAAEAAAELEDLGFTALWIPDIGGGPILDTAERLLASTTKVTIATGILNLWLNDAADTAARYASATEAYGERLLLGIGCSHAPIVDAKAAVRYSKPLSATKAFLDAIDDAPRPVPIENRLLAALGPKMLELAATRARGAHPYLATPEHSGQARQTLGEGPLLAPEQTVIFANDRAQARAIGAEWLRTYVVLPNYANNLVRSGFSENDLSEISDRLFDATIAWGDEDAIVQRVKDHRSAGADHVCIQVLTADQREFPREQWRRLAAAFA